MVKEVKITLKKSLIGRPKKHQRTLESLRLTKLNKTVRMKVTPEIEGMVKKIAHLVEVREIE